MQTPDNNGTMTHPPAAIVGGRRIAHRNENRIPISADALHGNMNYDLPANMDRAYPTEAVKKMHEKPTPTVQPIHVARGTSGGQQRFIPRKITH